MEGSDQLKLDDYTVGLLEKVIYIPNFISSAEEAQLLHNIYEAPISKWKSLKNRRLQNWGGVVHEKGLLPQDLPPWIAKITERICQQTGLFPSPINHVLINEYLPNQGIMLHQDGPAYFPVVAILSLGSPIVIDFTPHPRLIEGTKNMQEESAANGRPTLESTVWTNESSCEPVDDHHKQSLLLMPCSLLIFKDQAYADYLHGIQDSDVQSLAKIVNTSEALKLPDQATSGKSFELGNGEQHQIIGRTTTRVSLTCRLVLKVHRNLFQLCSCCDSFTVPSDSIGCSLVGSLGALYNGVLVINLVMALFALVAIENNSQNLGRTYAALLACGILLDIMWFILFSHEIWNISSEKHGPLFLFSLRLVLWMQIIGFSVRSLSSLLWIQMYRLGVSWVDSAAYRASDFDVRNSFLNPPVHEPVRQNSNSDDILGGSIYDPAYYSSLFEDSLDKRYAIEGGNQIICPNASTSAAEPLLRSCVSRSFQVIDVTDVQNTPQNS